ncbi:helix-turn-helix domain-containing protein [Aneurinibacillus thermoaerophilus]|uniref:helix-turn-helix domain-containing protein n=1 Tax=Aneurinibacillus thermoaerophilus TaxID=143495 RepID=UPI002E1B6837|nr:helix-turn-helix domain-containing protein [Aneurinibacillus thermoaerophilus]MED0737827.1 helix-turn-helix domain-containing protein [Aneurinibacillus thermoaerophilus]
MIAATNIERRHLTEQRRNIYIACEDLNFFWDEDQVSEVIAMWNMGLPVEYIASNFGREVDETAILIFDLARKGKIKLCRGGIWG